MKRHMAGLVAVAAIGNALALLGQTPNVSEVCMAQDSSSLTVSVTYKLDAPAIVTLGVFTNGCPIGDAALRGVTGDVNKLVTNVNETCTIVWHPDTDWADGRKRNKDVTAKVTSWATNCPPDFMALNLVDRDVVRYYTSKEALPYDITSDLYRTDWLLMRKIPAANKIWMMGEAARWNPPACEKPRLVTLTEDYYIGVFEMTVAQHARLVGADSSDVLPRYASYDSLRGAKTDGEDSIDWPNTRPLHKVNPNSSIAKYRAGLGVEVDLPTEAQWEYACRAGERAALYDGSEFSATNSARLGWSKTALEEAGLSGRQPGGRKPANRWDLYDLYGNVMEWCLDWIDTSVDGSTLETTDPKGISSAAYRVQRGGAFDVDNGRSAVRIGGYPPNSGYSNQGYRLAVPTVAPLKAK